MLNNTRVKCLRFRRYYEYTQKTKYLFKNYVNKQLKTYYSNNLSINNK